MGVCFFHSSACALGTRVRQIIWFGCLEECAWELLCLLSTEDVLQFQAAQHCDGVPSSYLIWQEALLYQQKKPFVVHPNADISVSARAILMTLHSA